MPSKRDGNSTIPKRDVTLLWPKRTESRMAANFARRWEIFSASAIRLVMKSRIFTTTSWRAHLISSARTLRRLSKTMAQERYGTTYLHLPLQHKRNTRGVVTEWKFPRKQNYLDKHGSSIYQLHRSCAERGCSISRIFPKQPTSEICQWYQIVTRGNYLGNRWDVNLFY